MAKGIVRMIHKTKMQPVTTVQIMPNGKVYTDVTTFPVKVGPRGYFAAFKRADGTVFTGFSLCKRGDKFNKLEGQCVAIDKATTRATYDDGKNILNVPQSMLADYAEFVGRCKAYFKTDKIS
jgi:hypothetical protein